MTKEEAELKAVEVAIRINPDIYHAGPASYWCMAGTHVKKGNHTVWALCTRLMGHTGAHVGHQSRIPWIDDKVIFDDETSET